jgi:hypothetical protein
MKPVGFHMLRVPAYLAAGKRSCSSARPQHLETGLPARGNFWGWHLRKRNHGIMAKYELTCVTSNHWN